MGAHPRPTTVDYGILEPSTKVACVPADFAWSDIGSWRALAEARAEDADGTGTIVLAPGTGSASGRHLDHDSATASSSPAATAS